MLHSFLWSTEEILTISNDAQCTFLKTRVQCLLGFLNFGLFLSLENYESPPIEFPTFYSSTEK